MPQIADADARNQVEVSFASRVVQVHAFGPFNFQHQGAGTGGGKVLEEKLSWVHVVRVCGFEGYRVRGFCMRNRSRIKLDMCLERDKILKKVTWKAQLCQLFCRIVK